jgi:hypothetical protein
MLGTIQDAGLGGGTEDTWNRAFDRIKAIARLISERAREELGIKEDA